MWLSAAWALSMRSLRKSARGCMLCTKKLAESPQFPISLHCPGRRQIHNHLSQRHVAALDGRERGHGSWRAGCYDHLLVSKAHSKITPSPQPFAPRMLCRMCNTLVLLRNSGTEICMLGLRRWSTRPNYAGCSMFGFLLS